MIFKLVAAAMTSAVALVAERTIRPSYFCNSDTPDFYNDVTCWNYINNCIYALINKKLIGVFSLTYMPTIYADFGIDASSLPRTLSS